MLWRHSRDSQLCHSFTECVHLIWPAAGWALIIQPSPPPDLSSICEDQACVKWLLISAGAGPVPSLPHDQAVYRGLQSCREREVWVQKASRPSRSHLNITTEALSPPRFTNHRRLLTHFAPAWLHSFMFSLWSREILHGTTWHSFTHSLIHSSSSSHLSLGVLADFPWHVMGTLDERAGNVVVVHRDDGQRDEEVNQEDHHWVDLRMHLIGQRVGHAVHKGDICVVPVTLRGNKERKLGKERGQRGDSKEKRGVERK